jgi:hypothetical protein
MIMVCINANFILLVTGRMPRLLSRAFSPGSKLLFQGLQLANVLTKILSRGAFGLALRTAFFTLLTCMATGAVCQFHRLTNSRKKFHRHTNFYYQSTEGQDYLCNHTGRTEGGLQGSGQSAVVWILRVVELVHVAQSQSAYLNKFNRS